MPIPSKKEPIEKLSARKKVFDTLQSWIIDGTLKPNEKLSDAEIAEYFSVSRTPVREAFQLLEKQKLIQIIPGKETLVMPIDKKNIYQIYSLLALLHGMAVQFAIPHITEKDIAHLEKIHSKLQDSFESGSLVSVRKNDKDFHDYILMLADNEYLVDFTEQLIVNVHRIENLSFQYRENQVKSAEEHMNIIKAIKNRDIEAAKAAMEANWLGFFNNLDSHPESIG